MSCTGKQSCIDGAIARIRDQNEKLEAQTRQIDALQQTVFEQRESMAEMHKRHDAYIAQAGRERTELLARVNEEIGCGMSDKCA